MSKIKCMVLIICILFICGCNADYSLKIDENDNVEETILIKSENNSESQEIYNDIWPLKVYYDDPDIGDNPEKIEGIEYYPEELLLENNYYQKKYNYKFSLNKLRKANSILSCYEHFYVSEDSKEKTLTLSTSAKFLCMEDYSNLNKVNIDIEVAKPVIDSNASIIDGNIYKWEITKDNYKTSAIILTYQKEEKVDKKEKDKDKIKSKYGLTIALISLGVFLIFIIGIFIYNIKKNM